MSVKQNEINIQWIDTLKGIGIILVVAGHTLSSDFRLFVYSFHMPLFFMISGYLFKEDDVINFAKRKIKSIAIPYFSYIVIFSLLEIYKIDFSNPNLLLKIKYIIYNSLYGGELLTGQFGVFWFVSVLFITQQLYNLLLKTKNKNLVFMSILLMYALSYMYPNINKASALDFMVTLNAIMYFYIGNLMRCGLIKIHKYISIVVSLIYFYLSLNYPSLFFIDMKYSNFGIPVVSSIGCVFVFSMFSYISNRISKIEFLNAIGVASMTIMFTHQFIHINISRVIFDNIFYIFVFSLVQSYMVHLLIRSANKTTKFFLGVR